MGGSSYHYEEIATYCYKNKVKSKAIVFEKIEAIRDSFIANYLELKEKSKLPCLTIAMHGDFKNVRLGIRDGILIDKRVRDATGIIRETDDCERMDKITARIADQVAGDRTTEFVIDAINRGKHVIELLTHPRQWNSPFWIKFREEIQRIFKGLLMKLWRIKRIQRLKKLTLKVIEYYILLRIILIQNPISKNMFH